MSQKREKYVCYLLLVVIIVFVSFSTYLNLCNSTKTDAQVFKENIKKVVEIRVSDDGSIWGYGTGCFVRKDGIILTNRHMVVSNSTNEIFENIQVRLPTDDDFCVAKVISISSEADLALLSIERVSNFFKFAKTVENGERVFTIGNPNGFGLSFTQGNVSSKCRNVLYNGNTIKSIQTSFVINEGNSGGPVFDAKGKLVGLISFRLKDKSGDVIQGVSFAIPLDIIKIFISSAKI